MKKKVIGKTSRLFFCVNFLLSTSQHERNITLEALGSMKKYEKKE